MEQHHHRKRRRLGILVGVAPIVLLVGDLLLTRARHKVPIAYDTTRATSPVNADGTIDYVAALDAEFGNGVTDDNNAARFLVQAFGPAGLPSKHGDAVARRLHIPVPPEKGAYLVTFDDFQAAATQPSELDLVSWPVGNLTQVAEWVKVNQTPLNLILQAAPRPRFFMPMRAGEPQTIVSAQLPQLNRLRESAMLLAAHTRLRAGAGDFAAARADLQAMHRLARLLSQSPTVIGCLLGGGIEALACHTSRSIAQHANLDAVTAEPFLRDALALQQLSSLAQAVDKGERYTVLECSMNVAIRGPVVTSLYGGGPTPAEHEPPGYYLVPIRHADAMRLENATFDSLVAAYGKKTRAERTAAFQAVTQACESAPPVLVAAAAPQVLLSIYLPAVVQEQGNMDRVTAELRMTQITWALTMYRLKNRKFPATLEELSPQLLPAVPLDPFTEASFVYAWKESGYTLYSVGRNGRDDHGARTAPADDIDASTD